MLRHLYIKNFAIIDELDLELNNGMTALTGETGAGKSILLGALNLVLGDRAETDSINQNADFAEIVAEFDIRALDNVSSWLVSNELNVDDDCILRRRITRDGRSRAFINGTPVNLQIIRELTEMLIDIHGQHEHQSIMKPKIQRQLLDDYAGHLPLLENVSHCYVELKLVEEQLAHLRKTTAEQNDRIDLLRFQTQELDALAVSRGEYEALEAEHKIVANAEKIIAATQNALMQLSDDENTNTQSSLTRIINAMSEFEDINEHFGQVSAMLQDALVQIEESVSVLHNIVDDIEHDPAQLEKIEQRMQDIIDIARKHHVAPGQLHEQHNKLVQELDDIDHIDERLDELESEFKQLDSKYVDMCEKLSASRARAAHGLDKKISKSMQTLGMAGGQFVVNITTDRSLRTAHGFDNIEFTVTANAGQPCKSLAKVASGGELARISLAIQMIIADNSRIPTLVFDEVDSGVGGGIAEIVGQQLHALGQIGKSSGNKSPARATNQVICITHLPQVASQAHNHLRVEKHSDGRRTSSRVIPLDQEQRRQEIARMLSGVEITDESLAHADQMLGKAEENLRISSKISAKTAESGEG
jgi:DNA repair protein RecN (Recombination protein N)